MSAHKHTWTGLWGPHGEGEHVHQCFDRRCAALLIGNGRGCDDAALHEVRR